MTVTEHLVRVPQAVASRLEDDRRGRELLGGALDLLEEAIALNRRIQDTLTELSAAESAEDWELLARVHALLGGLDALGRVWFGGRRLSGVTLEVGCPALTVAIPEVSAASLGLDLTALEQPTLSALAEHRRRVSASLEALLNAREICRGAATRLRWRCG